MGGEEPESAKETFPETVCGQVKSAEFRIHRRDELQPGDRLIGPCLVSDEFGALWIDKGWQGVMGSRRTVSLHRQISENPYASPFFKFAKTELFTSRFLCLVEEMGAQLERTALSVNVRERLDFSCALLDKSGRLVANATTHTGPSWGHGTVRAKNASRSRFPRRGGSDDLQSSWVRRLASARRNRDVAGVR